MRHSGALLSARLLARLASIPVFIYVAAKLGPSLFGIVIFVIAFVEVSNDLSNVGLSRFGARALARDEMPHERLAGILLTIRTLLSIVLVTTAIAVLLIVDPPSPQFEVILLGLLAIVLSSFIQVTEALFTGAERFTASAVLQTIGKAIYLVAAPLLLWLGFSVVAVMCAYLLSIVIEGALRMVYTVRRVTGFSLRFSPREVFLVLRRAMPFAVAVIATLVYFRADTLLLGLIKGDETVGVYGVAFSLFSFFIWIPIILSRVLLPKITSTYKRNRLEGERLSWFWYYASGVLSVPVVFAAILLVGPVIRLLLPSSYHESVQAVQILLLSMPLMFMNSVAVVIFMVKDKEKLSAHIAVITTVLIIVLNLVLILTLGMLGAAVAMVAATTVRWIMYHLLTVRYLNSAGYRSLRDLGVPAIAICSMIAVTFISMPLGLPFVLIAGVGTYVLVISGGLFWKPLRRAVAGEELGVD